MTTTNRSPRVYFACLAAYNAGKLHGAWIDATQGAWGIWADIQAMLAASPVPDAEEYAIHDYEGFEGARLSEATGIEEVVALADFIMEHGAVGAAVLNDCGGDLCDAREAMTDRYLGCHASAADFMQEVTWAAVAIPKRMVPYIDWAAMARDALLSGDITAVATTHDAVHLFAG